MLSLCMALCHWQTFISLPFWGEWNAITMLLFHFPGSRLGKASLHCYQTFWFPFFLLLSVCSIFISFLSFFFFFFGHTPSTWKFLGQRANPHHSFELYHSWVNARSLSHCAIGELPKSLFFAFFGGGGFGYVLSMQKFWGQGSNLSYSSNQSHSGDNTGSLTHWATKELPLYFFSSSPVNWKFKIMLQLFNFWKHYDFLT